MNLFLLQRRVACVWWTIARLRTIEAADDRSDQMDADRIKGQYRCRYQGTTYFTWEIGGRA